MSLLHSLRAFKLPVPFTFDSDKAGFDIGKWAEIKEETVKPTYIMPGEAGFGVGIAPQSALDSIGNLTPMSGYDDPTNDNYGNYQGSDGSIMCFIPAFCYRSGYESAPSKARDGLNALEITYDTSLEGQDGWILHRAFWNNGQRISGFFIDKYLASTNSSKTGCVSVKIGNPISLCDYSGRGQSSDIDSCSGYNYDAIVLGRKRGTRYCCASLFAYSAIAMLSLAHSQACGDGNTEHCAWNDENPWCKGNNRNLKDYYDSSVTYTKAPSDYSNIGRTGSGMPFAKTTHNGQNCGVADINGCLYEVALGVTQPKSNSDSRYGKLLVLKTSADICSIESYSSNIDDVSLYNEVDYTRNLGSSSTAWPNTTAQFSQDNSGADWALTGCYPRRNGEVTSSQISYLIKGYYYYKGAVSNYSDYCPIVGGSYLSTSDAGLFYRNSNSWDSWGYTYGFRCMAVPLA